MYAIRLDDDNVGKEFTKACKVLGIKQKTLIEGYMKDIIKRAHHIEVLKNVDGIIGVPFDVYTEEGREEMLHLFESKNG
jgi:hypothetical protein